MDVSDGAVVHRLGGRCPVLAYDASLLPFLHLNQPQLCGHGGVSTSGTSPELVSLEVSKLFLRGSSSNYFRL